MHGFSDRTYIKTKKSEDYPSSDLLFAGLNQLVTFGREGNCRKIPRQVSVKRFDRFDVFRGNVKYY